MRTQGHLHYCNRSLQNHLLLFYLCNSECLRLTWNNVLTSLFMVIQIQCILDLYEYSVIWYDNSVWISSDSGWFPAVVSSVCFSWHRSVKLIEFVLNLLVAMCTCTAASVCFADSGDIVTSYHIQWWSWMLKVRFACAKANSVLC